MNDDIKPNKFTQNLISAIFQGINFEISEDVERGLNYSINLLNEREKKAIYGRYADRKTLKEIGNELNVSQERVRQIILKSLCKMRNPSRSNYIKFGYEGYTQMMKNRAKDGVGVTPIEELQFRTRTYNALKRGGINVVSDIKSKEQLMKIRNFGKGTFDIVIQKLTDIGYELPESEEIPCQ